MWAWLLKNPWRAIFIVAALAFAAMAVYTMSLRQSYIVLDTQRAADQASFGEQRAKLQSEIDRQALLILTYKQQEARFAENARANTLRLEQAQEASAEALEKFEQARKKREASENAWWRVYEGRSDTCKAATEALDVACKEVGRL